MQSGSSRLDDISHDSDLIPYPSSQYHPYRTLIISIVLLIALALACSLPGISKRETPVSLPSTQVATVPVATSLPPTLLPLPPQLVEIDPMVGSALPWMGPITFYFNQGMDRSSVEQALTIPPGQLTWIDNATLQYVPEKPFSPEEQVEINIDISALAKNGLPLSEAIHLSYRVAAYLGITQRLPKPGSRDINPTSAVVVAFNRPVVALGGELSTQKPAFFLEPAASGQGEWLNTSTYIFYPEPALAGGEKYTVRLNALMATDGSTLKEVESWEFATEPPELVNVEPVANQSSVHLDTGLVMDFNQPMDAASVEANFSLLDPNSFSVSGKFTWNDDYTSLTFQPEDLLKYDSTYQVILKKQAQASGGTPLQSDYNARFFTVDSLKVIRSDPSENSSKYVYGGVSVVFNSPIRERDVLQFIEFTPEVTNLSFWASPEGELNIYGKYAPDTAYTLTISPNLVDEWGGRLGEEFKLHFRTTSYYPDLVATLPSDVLFMTPRDSRLSFQAMNVFHIPYTIGEVPLSDLPALLDPSNYELRQSYRPPKRETYVQDLDIPSNRYQLVEIPLSRNGRLQPGLYHLRINLADIYAGPYILVVSNIHLIIKLSPTNTLVWAIDLRTGEPVSDANVTVFNVDGSVLVQGKTDIQGIFTGNVTPDKRIFEGSYVQLGMPGDDDFALALYNWNLGVDGWSFGVPMSYRLPRLEAYLYTDRPIYRPGQSVFFRVIARQAYNGRYRLPEIDELPLQLSNECNDEKVNLSLKLSSFGTASGSYNLPDDIVPCQYFLTSEEANYARVGFRVAEYRKPEINLNVSFSNDQVIFGDTLTATVNARYFFDAPAGDVPVTWTLYREPDYFYLPEYQVGSESTAWLYAMPEFLWRPFGIYVSEGSGTTDLNGLLELKLDPDPEDQVSEPMRFRYTLEVTATDESGLPVSSRAFVITNPGKFFIGVRPGAWSSQAGKAIDFAVLVVDWDKQPAGARRLRAVFQKVIWERIEPPEDDLYGFPTFEPRYTLISQEDFATNKDGEANLTFTPPEAGVYQIEVYGRQPGEESIRTQVTVWVGGEEQTAWPNLPNQHIRLIADNDTYQPGQTAQIFIPNPFEQGAQALVTVERGAILRHEVITVSGAGINYSLPLTSEDAPNVYLAVTILGSTGDGKPDFRQGYINLSVSPLEQTLTVELVGAPQRLGPGESVVFDIRVTDSQGKPVVGEFSLSVVDLAVLALADPNSEDILTAFYGKQPLNVLTGIGLAAYSRRMADLLGGLGGGGDGGMLQPTMLREEFEDTAYWNAQIVTDANGEARVTVSLPDNLTTWLAEVRGLTVETLVGQASQEVIVTKDVLIRPVTPRFLVFEDHALLAAVVMNNTDQELKVDVALQAKGFELDKDTEAIQRVTIPAKSRARVEWWGTALDVDSLDLLFIAHSIDETGTVSKIYEDAVRPEYGPLPVIRQTAPQTFGTAGILEKGGERLEVVSLPRSFDARAGHLRVELSSTLAGGMLKALEALDVFPYQCTEQVLSRFLANLETYRLLQDQGLEIDTLKPDLDEYLSEGLELLLSRQNEDGGWGWWGIQQSDSYITAYVVIGLSRARSTNMSIDGKAYRQAIQYLQKQALSPRSYRFDWQLDRLVFLNFALSEAGKADLDEVMALYDVEDRLNPWARALLAETLVKLSPDDEHVQTLLSDLESEALRSATGAHWEDKDPGWHNMSTPIFNSAVVLYALAQQDAHTPLVADAMHYLMANRSASGGWATTYETAWVLMALTRYLSTTGELAADFEFKADVNGSQVLSGQADEQKYTSLTAEVPISDLYAQEPNALLIKRTSGDGRLYYTAHLNVYRPTEEIAPLNRGVSVNRAYYSTGCPVRDDREKKYCPMLHSAKPGELINVRLTITLPETAYYLMVEDFIPAGTEVLDTSLKTSKMGAAGDYDPRQPFLEGWGWWYFNDPQIYSDHIAWSANSLPAGTYELTYTLVVLQPGEYRVLPASAWQFYFPEVQGNSAGEIFTIEK